MKLTNKLLFLYCLILSLFVVLSGLLNGNNLLGGLILLPIPSYFILNLAKRRVDGSLPRSGKGLLTVGIIFIILLGTGVYNISVARENVSHAPSPSPIVVSQVGNTMTRVEVAVENKPVLIKSEPDDESETLETVESTAVFESIGKDGKWYKVLLNNGSFGWINEQYVYEIIETR